MKAINGDHVPAHVCAAGPDPGHCATCGHKLSQPLCRAKLGTFPCKLVLGHREKWCDAGGGYYFASTEAERAGHSVKPRVGATGTPRNR